MNGDVVQTLYDYHFQRLREIWGSIATLSDAQFLQAVPYSLGSLRNQTVHLMDDELSWLSRIQNKPRTSLNTANFVTIADTRDASLQSAAQLKAFMDTLDDAALESTFDWHPPFLEAPQRITLWQAVLHIINHATDHRAQILRILHDLGAPTFDQDLMGYLIQSGQTAINQPT